MLTTYSDNMNILNFDSFLRITSFEPLILCRHSIELYQGFFAHFRLIFLLPKFTQLTNVIMSSKLESIH